MKFRNGRMGAAAVAIGGMVVAVGSSALAEPGPTPYTYKQATFKEQGVKVGKLTAASQMTKDLEAPARAFTGPTSMVVDPDNPRIVVAATADLRSKLCYLAVSKDAGRTWHLSKELPTLPDRQYCTGTTAGVPEAVVAFGRDGTLFYGHMAYGDADASREGPNQTLVSRTASVVVSRTKNLGETWERTVAKNNRGAPSPAGNVSAVPGMAVDTSGPRDVVYVGFNEAFPDSPADSPLRNPHVNVVTSTDGGLTFGTPVDFNTLKIPGVQAAGREYPLFMRSGFGSPFLYAKDGVLLAVSGPEFPAADRPAPPPEAGQGLTPGSWYAYPMPQLIARSTDQGKTFTISHLGDPILAGTGSFTGLGWTQEGGDKGTFVAVYAATPATSPTIALADIVVQRSTDSGVTWSSPLAIDDDPPDQYVTGFYPQLNVAPNGRIDVAWQDNRARTSTDFFFDVQYTYSTDGGLTWAKNQAINDRPLNFNYGISFNSDLRQPVGVASTNEYVIVGWADTRNATDLTQTQDNYAVGVQFEALPTTKNTTAQYIAAIFGGLVVAGIALLLALQLRKRGGAGSGGGSARRTSRVPVGA